MSGNANSGRRPKPTALHVLKGNPSRKHLNAAEPLPAPTAPDAPGDLTGREREIWDYLTSELRAMGTLAHSDADVIYALVDARARLERARARLVERGEYYDQVFVDGAGVEHIKPAADPAVKTAKDCWAAIRALAGILGLEPSSRSRLKVNGGGEVDESVVINA